MECVREDGGASLWAVELPPANDPLATATADGDLLVKAGARLLRIDPRGRTAWELLAPDGQAITSNPVVTANGRVLFATGTTIHCLAQ